MAKVLCVLYDDPTDGYPTTYARDDLPVIDHYPGGRTTPTPKATDNCRTRTSSSRSRSGPPI